MTSKGFTINERGQPNRFAIEPKVYVDETPRIEFTKYTEKLNGPLAMIGFVSLIAVEVITGHGLIGWLTSF
ncbi:high light inducible protein [Nostoc sp. LPT]|uniref:high light inducible protein n=1 Tax=Nostoc sp. LPT TaxID=2815387 RepID=UPI001D44C7E4|nr:high light inducible protein [Nostoc sp. LPT]MBN4006101.1 high light inducible protein [Nostoc sp. LPT]